MKSSAKRNQFFVILVFLIALVSASFAEGNSPPVIENLPSQLYACENSYFSHFFNVINPDEGNIKFSVQSVPPSYIFNIFTVNSSGNLTNCEIFTLGRLSKSDKGDYEETIWVYDAEHITFKLFNITVIEVNNPPVLENIINQTAVVNKSFYYQVSATDLEDGLTKDGNLTFSLTFLTGEQFFNINKTRGIINFTPTVNELGVYDISICVSDKGLVNPHENLSLCNETNESETTCKNFSLRVSSGGTDIDLDGFSIEGGNYGPIDCNDTNLIIYPTAMELCDGLDNDCDGTADEGCCFDNDKDGYNDKSCGGDDCNDAESSVYPGAPDELCNGIDNDCDGLVDEDYVSTPTSCGTGACYATGSTSCVAGSVVDSCTPGTPALNDATCNSIDEDCNGANDEDYASTPTSCGIGACVATGQTSCVSGSIMDSCTPGIPIIEACDNADNDCDGTTDEDLTRGTTCGVGACLGNTGTETCTAGNWGGNTCDPLAGATAEKCDNSDNNCDGQIDDGLTKAADNILGLCSANTQTCAAGSWSDDVSNYAPVAETCDNSDNNCDGLVDEELTQICGINDVGVCAFGIETCSAGDWVGCTAIFPSTEICDGLDNNCNSEIDEGFPDNDNDKTADCVDLDDDNDGILDENDNCPFTYNPNQEDLDIDGRGDVCDSDIDGDSVLNVDDTCPLTLGRAEYQGCPIGIKNFVELHVIDRAKSSCGGAGSCKLPVENAEIRVFDRNNYDFQTKFTKNPKGTEYPNIFEFDIGRVGSCTTNANGECIAGEEQKGEYLVIVKYEYETGKTIYTGKPKSPEDFKDTDEDGVTDLAYKDFQIIKVINKDGSLDFKAGSKTIITGSMLEVIYPQYVIWENETILYPFIFTSDSEWEVNVCVYVPEGYEIIGENCTQMFISGETKDMIFKLAEVGSPEPDVGIGINTKHQGKTKKIKIQIPGKRTEKYLKEREKAKGDSRSKKVSPLVVAGVLGFANFLFLRKRFFR